MFRLHPADRAEASAEAASEAEAASAEAAEAAGRNSGIADTNEIKRSLLQVQKGSVFLQLFAYEGYSDRRFTM